MATPASSIDRTTSRRSFLLAAAGAMTSVACGGSKSIGAAPQAAAEAPDTSSTADTATASLPPTTATAVPPAATATPVIHPAGSSTRVLLPGTAAETPLFLHHSGVAGPVALVLGGVHGNEPGGWEAADEVAANWRPSAGSLLVIPHANVLAIASFVRTNDDIGDLNRLYPGDAGSPLLMERLAAEIVGVASEFSVSLLLDMHESWAFYREYPNTGTAALGQTITGGTGPLSPGFAEAIRDELNPSLPERDQFIVRSGSPFAGNQTPGAGGTSRGRSSLGLGAAVPGLTPILIEMGQQDQAVERRVELHLMVARAMLRRIGLL